MIVLAMIMTAINALMMIMTMMMMESKHEGLIKMYRAIVGYDCTRVSVHTLCNWKLAGNLPRSYQKR